MSDSLGSLPSLPRFLGTLTARIIAVGGPSVIIFIAMCIKLKIGSQPTGLFLALLFSFATIAAVLIFNKFKPAMFLGFLGILWVAMEVKAPAMAESAQQAAQAQQYKIEQVMDRMSYEVPGRITCDRTTAPGLVFFAKHMATGRKEVRMWYSKEYDYIQCWDRPGVHPHTGEDLIAVNAKVVALIKRQGPENTRTEHQLAAAQSELPLPWGPRQTVMIPARP